MQSTHLVRYENVQIEVQAQGQGTPVVLLPSLGRDGEDFGVLAGALAARGFRALSPTPRGIGGSHGPETGISLHTYARDVAEVIAHEACGPAVVLGHAFGSWVARSAATDFPMLVKGVVIAAAAAQNFDPRLRECIDKCEDTRLPDEERLACLRMAFFAPGHDPRPWLQGWHPHLKAAQRAARAATKLEEFWGAGTAPLLDVMAADDPFRLPGTRDENRQALGERVSTAIIPHASHALIAEQPMAVAEAVCRWVRTLEADPAA